MTLVVAILELKALLVIIALCCKSRLLIATAACILVVPLGSIAIAINAEELVLMKIRGLYPLHCFLINAEARVISVERNCIMKIVLGIKDCLVDKGGCVWEGFEVALAPCEYIIWVELLYGKSRYYECSIA